jgi:hypothetical protein
MSLRGAGPRSPRFPIPLRAALTAGEKDGEPKRRMSRQAPGPPRGREPPGAAQSPSRHEVFARGQQWLDGLAADEEEL